MVLEKDNGRGEEDSTRTVFVLAWKEREDYLVLTYLDVLGIQQNPVLRENITIEGTKIVFRRIRASTV